MDYFIRADIKPKEIYPASLRLGGQNPRGDRISFTNYYMELNGQPYFAICGEFHYSRYPESGWETELRKMKASGINVAATYIFWNHHEETEGTFDWQGNRNLRGFMEACGRAGLYVILRIGPFCHGEARNGGLPDWLFGRSFDVRSNDEGYLAYVRRLYAEIGRQAAGLMFADGGPVIGIQLENELNAAAALWELTAKQGDEYLSGGSGGPDGEAHMRYLKETAIAAGLAAPLYTSTGWGGAPVLEDEVLPLYGGYAYTPWSISARHPEQQPTGEYVFADFHSDSADTREFAPPYPKTKYPFACCEMGGGMQTWYLSRFQVEPESVPAMSLMKIAGGCNFIGYYMFHGGTNPVGRTGYLNESTTPRITYDFQAVIGEFGQNRQSNDLLRPLHYFLHAFGGRLAPMATALPQGAETILPENTETLRYAVRTDGRSGFLFVNNYQDHVEMKEHQDVRFAVSLQGGSLSFPKRPLTVRKNASFMFPFHFDLDGIRLRYASAQPVTLLETPQAHTYFFLMPEGIDGEFAFEAEGIAGLQCGAGTAEREPDGSYLATVPHRESALIIIKRSAGPELRIYAMSSAEASRLWRIESGGRTHILFSDAPLAAAENGLRLFSAGRHEFMLKEYTGSGNGDGSGWRPESKEVRCESERDGDFRLWRFTVPERTIGLDVRRLHDHKLALRIKGEAADDPQCGLTDMPDGLQDILLKIDYTGNVGYAFSGGHLFHDHFYNGALWEIGLARFWETIRASGGEIIVETTPLRKGVLTVEAGAAMAARQHFEGEQSAVFHRVDAEPVYSVNLVEET